MYHRATDAGSLLEVKCFEESDSVYGWLSTIIKDKCNDTYKVIFKIDTEIRVLLILFVHILNC